MSGKTARLAPEVFYALEMARVTLTIGTLMDKGIVACNPPDYWEKEAMHVVEVIDAIIGPMRDGSSAPPAQ